MGNFTANPDSVVTGIYNASVTTAAAVSANTYHLIHFVHCLNTTAAVAYLQVFDKQVASVTLGTTVAEAAYGIPANGVLALIFEPPLRMNVGLSVAGTTTATGNTTAALATVITYNARA